MYQQWGTQEDAIICEDDWRSRQVASSDELMYIYSYSKSTHLWYNSVASVSVINL